MWIDFSYEKKINYSKSEYYKSINDFLCEWYSDIDVIKVFTSGSTGPPKKIFLKKKYLYKRAIKTVIFLGLHHKKNVKGLLCLSPDFIATKMFLIRAIIFKWKILCIPSSSNPLKNIYGCNFDISSMVPMQVISSIENLNKIKILLIGGSKISKYIKNKLQKISTDCYLTYGMTETYGHIALKKINGDNQSNYYRLLDDISITTDNRNCLNIYFQYTNHSPIQTNDIVSLQSKNTFEWIGRYDNIINTGGIKVIPELIERKINFLIPFYRRFFISSIPDKILGEKIILVIEGKFFSIKIPNYLFQGKNKFFKPKKIYFISNFDENFIGKYNKKLILEKIIHHSNL
ncbi:AMP-binding protein [Blattabacterium cuenoti]|uniref:AMP-binding protein n=1 Tax=Blattabacterium cuenoti TaxID=1653831 RepID=UPI00163BB47D|nr:AMP-binding protein [Blattabacterium cuenoti]